MIDIFVLDDKYKKSSIVDLYESMIWTERYLDEGDFEIQLSKKQFDRFDLKIDQCLSIDDSSRVMIIRTITEKDEDSDTVLVSGPSLERVLQERVLKEALTHRKPGELPTVNSGLGITSSAVHYQNSTNATVVPQGTWVTTKPTTPTDQFLWVRVRTVFADGATDNSYRVIYENESPGTPESVTTLYVDSTSQATTSKTWIKEFPTGSGLGNYIWRKVITKYSNETRVTYQASSKGSATGVSSGSNYLHIAYSDNSIGKASFSHEWPTGRGYIGTYTDSVAADSEDPKAYSWRHITGQYDPVWIIKEKPHTLAELLYEYICVQGALDLKDRLLPRANTPHIPSTVDFPDFDIELTVGGEVLQTPIHDICEMFDLGYRMGINPNEDGIYFEVYSGNERTGDQNVFPPVIFSPQLNNINGTSELKSNEEYRNVAYVHSYLGITKVYPEGSTENEQGLDRRIIFVDGSEVSAEDDKPLELIEKLGRDALREASATHEIDGNIPTRVDSEFDTGDIVEMRTAEGTTNKMRVTERIIVCDDQGKRIYPTLATKQLITPGTWDSWEANVSWDDAYGTWDNW